MKTYAYKIGAVFYVLWGLLHIVGGGALLLQAINEGATPVLATIGSNVPAIEIPTIASDLTAAVLAYYAWNVLWIGVLVTVIGARLNWQNNRLGYWLNLTIVSIVDGGLLIMLVFPGYMTWADGMVGVVLWIPALVFSTIGWITNDVQAVRQITVA